MSETQELIRDAIKTHRCNCNQCRTDWADKDACLAAFIDEALRRSEA